MNKQEEIELRKETMKNFNKTFKGLVKLTGGASGVRAMSPWFKMFKDMEQ